jgi:hypothetical protein
MALLGIVSIGGLATVGQHHLLGARYLIDRTALLFLPLFTLSFIAIAVAAPLCWRRFPAFASLTILALCAAGMSINFARVANLRVAMMWRYDADTKEMLSALRSLEPASSAERRVDLGVSSSLEPAIAFYSESASWLQKVDRDGLWAADHDYYYVTPQDLERLDREGLRQLKHYPLSNNYLLKK